MLIIILLSILGVMALAIILFLFIVMLARGKNRETSKINSKDGIQEECYVRLGNVSQFIQIRGENRNNPVMLFLHGGPGGPMAYISIYYQRKLEKEFTVVQWDQRGCGRSYFQGASNEIPNTKQMLLDLDQLVDYLRERFSCEKVMIMAHSCGTLFGCQYIQQHPEKVSGYIGISQCVNVWETTIKMAKKALEEKGTKPSIIKKLTSSVANMENVKGWNDNVIKDFLTAKMLTQKIFPYKTNLTGGKTFWLGITSPYFSKVDLAWYKIYMSMDKFVFVQGKLLDECLFELNLNKREKKYEVPMLFINGACDTTSPASVVEEYVKSIEAPAKELYVMEQVGHSMFLEKTDEFCTKVLEWCKQNVNK